MPGSIPRQIFFKEMYILRAIISFVPPVTQTIEAIGHYITYGWRTYTNKWQCFGNMSINAVQVSEKKMIRGQLIVYYL